MALSEEEYNKHIAKVIENMNEHLQKSYNIEPFIDINADNLGLYAHIKETTCNVEVFADLLNELNNVIKAYRKNSVRNEKALAHNKINKHAMHLIRLYKMATELMLTGTVCTYRANDHDLLMDIRNGKYSTADGQMDDEFFQLVKLEEEAFDGAKRHSKLANTPNYNAIRNRGK